MVFLERYGRPKKLGIHWLKRKKNTGEAIGTLLRLIYANDLKFVLSIKNLLN